MKRLIFIFTILLCLSTAPAFADTAAIPEVPTQGMVTLLDLSAHKCLPCKMRAPIIVNLQKEHKGKAPIIFIDVWENRAETGEYGIRSIPTQIFFNKDGKEEKRHVGFIGKKSIVAVLTELGVK